MVDERTACTIIEHKEYDISHLGIKTHVGSTLLELCLAMTICAILALLGLGIVGEVRAVGKIRLETELLAGSVARLISASRTGPCYSELRLSRWGYGGVICGRGSLYRELPKGVSLTTLDEGRDTIKFSPSGVVSPITIKIGAGGNGNVGAVGTCKIVVSLRGRVRSECGER